MARLSQGDGTVWPTPAYATARSRGYPTADYYDDTPSEPDWEAGGQSWQEWQDWQSAAAPPALRPDHPSAQLPRVQFPPDHPSGPMYGPRGGHAAGRPARGSSAPTPRGPGRTRDSGRHESVTASVGYLTVRREIDDFDDPGPARRHSGGYQQQSRAGYQGEAGQYGSDPAGDWFYDDRSPQPVLYDNRSAQPVQYDNRSQDSDPRGDADAIRLAAEREAVAIKSAAEREAAELRARLDSMLGDLGQVVASYISDTLGGSGGAAAPARPKAALEAPARPKAEARVPAARAALTAAPDTTAGTKPDKPRTTPAGQRTAPTRAPNKPTGKPATKQQRAGRQKSAWRFAKYGTAGLLLFSLAAAGVEISQHGYSFFVFRENGQGDTPNVQPGRLGNNETDAQFVAQQAAAKAKAAHQAPTGRHAKTSPSTKGTTGTSTTGG